MRLRVGVWFLTVKASLTQRGQRVEVGGSTGWLVFGVDGFARDARCLGCLFWSQARVDLVESVCFWGF